MANYASACLLKSDYRFPSVVIRDRGNFQAVIAAAHEIGHVYV